MGSRDDALRLNSGAEYVLKERGSRSHPHRLRRRRGISRPLRQNDYWNLGRDVKLRFSGLAGGVT